MRKCTKCGKEKDETGFSKRKDGKKVSWCKECDNELHKKTYDKKKDYERHLKRKLKDPERYKKLARARVERYKKKNRKKYLETNRRTAAKWRQNHVKTEEDRKDSVKRSAKWQKANRQKTRVHRKVYRALKLGKIKKPENCEICNKVTKLEGHHRDYNKPYEIVWCCRSCHAYLHRIKISAES